MKKTFLIFISFLLAVCVLASCNNKEDPESSSEDASSANEEPSAAESTSYESEPSEMSKPSDVTDIPDVSDEPSEEPEPTKEEKLEKIHNSAEYPEDMVTFAEHYDQVIDYVYYYPEKKDLRPEIDLSKEASEDKPPLLIQWDDRWGYVPYGDGLIGNNGCGPVCLSMAALYLTGNPEYTPVYVAKMAEDNGYAVIGHGSSWSLMSRGCENLGLSARELGLDENVMKKELDKGHPIALVVRKGDFTYGGHFILITGYDEEGFTVNDSNNRANSAKHWTFDVLKGQIRNLWALSKKEA